MKLVRSRARGDFEVMLSPPEFMALKFFEEHAGETVSDCAEEMCVSRPTVSVLIQKLIKRGFLTKKTDSKDKRSIRLALSKKGQETMEKVQDHLRKVGDPVFDVLNAQEKEQLKKNLLKIITQHSHERTI